MAKRRSDSTEDMRKAFEAFDENGDGLISGDELEKFVSNIGEVFDVTEFSDIMNEIDSDGDGYINYEGTVFISFLYFGPPQVSSITHNG